MMMWSLAIMSKQLLKKHWSPYINLDRTDTNNTPHTLLPGINCCVSLVAYNSGNISVKHMNKIYIWNAKQYKSVWTYCGGTVVSSMLKLLSRIESMYSVNCSIFHFQNSYHRTYIDIVFFFLNFRTHHICIRWPMFGPLSNISVQTLACWTEGSPSLL